MSYLHDAIMESNRMEEEILSRGNKRPKSLKRPMVEQALTEKSNKRAFVPKKRKEKLSECGDPFIKEEMVVDDPSSLEEGIVADVVDTVKSALPFTDSKEEITEEKEKPVGGMVDIEEYLPKENFVESFAPLKEDYKRVARKFGESKKDSPIYESNEKRRQREATYRKCANINESYVIDESNINKWALDRTCMWHNVSPERLKAELLKKPYTGLERYYED